MFSDVKSIKPAQKFDYSMEYKTINTFIIGATTSILAVLIAIVFLRHNLQLHKLKAVPMLLYHRTSYHLKPDWAQIKSALILLWLIYFYDKVIGFDCKLCDSCV
jgi:hypothetical protein